MANCLDQPRSKRVVQAITLDRHFELYFICKISIKSRAHWQMLSIGTRELRTNKMELVAQMWSLIGLFTFIQTMLPPQLHQLLQRWWSSFQEKHFNSFTLLDVSEFNDDNGVNGNELYKSVEVYLGSLNAIQGASRVTMNRAKNSSRVEFCLAVNHTMEDCFHGATLWWTHNSESRGQEVSRANRKSFTLKMAKRDAKRLLSLYLDHITESAEAFCRRNMDRNLYTNTGDGRYESGWTGVSFKHPSTFESLALHPDLKKKIMTDLDRFRHGKKFYNRVGRAWKRGYLLYGPPGTGKSSLIAAMANYLRYDVYDLELTKVYDNTELRALLMQTTQKSIIVIEDIDCSLDLSDRLSKPVKPENGKGADDDDPNASRVTLSGLLNFTDGLWSCCGEERLFIFTTNHKELLDPALLRSGRMDMHILLSSCTFPAFKSLAFNYLQIEDHPLFSSVEETMMQSGGEMTPADITEILINHLDEPLKALNAVISAMDAKIQTAQLTTSPPVSQVISHTVVEAAGEEIIQNAHVTTSLPVSQIIMNPVAEAETAGEERIPAAGIENGDCTVRRRRLADTEHNLLSDV
eukprot:Gb_34239 [translate_table: standard]